MSLHSPGNPSLDRELSTIGYHFPSTSDGPSLYHALHMGYLSHPSLILKATSQAKHKYHLCMEKTFEFQG